MRVRRPLPAYGPVKGRWAAHRARQWSLVAYRARGHCEGCGASDRPLDLAHLFGRRHIVSEPWCSLAALTAALCRDCHRAVDGGRHPDLALRLRNLACLRLAALYRLRIAEFVESDDDDPLDVVRRLVRRLESLVGPAMIG